MDTEQTPRKSISVTIPREDVVAMLRRASSRYGLDFARFYDLGHADELQNPHLRSLWLLWGDLLNEGDVRSAT